MANSEDSDQNQGLYHCYFICIILKYHTMVEPLNLNFQVFTVKLVGVRKIVNFMKTYNRVKVHNQLMLTF